jgi:hypothetical protein
MARPNEPLTTRGQESKTLRERWSELDTDRQCSLDRKREHAVLTIPHLLPPEGKATHTPLEVPYNAMSAEGINALASRITSVVFPLTGQSVFELEVQAPEDGRGQDTTDIDEVMARFERKVMDTLAPTNLRAAINLAYKHLIAVGDCLLHMDDDFNFRLFRADQYVVRRRHEGEWMEIIIQEAVIPEFHPELQGIAKKMVDDPRTTTSGGNAEHWESLYTLIVKDPDTGRVTVRQEFRDVRIGKEETFEISPYMPMRWQALAGEPYGISLVEDNFGDVRALDALSKALLDGALLNAEYRWGVNPAGLTELQDVLDSINGDFIPTAPGDVFPLQFQNAAQISATQASVVHREAMLGRRFLLESVVQPQGERVTRFQVQRVAQELEGRLGGILSQASREVQEPILRRVIHVMGRKQMIQQRVAEEIQKQGGFVKMRIRAGLEILNREAERERLSEALQELAAMPPSFQRVFIMEELGRDWWASKGLETTGRVKTREQLQAEDAAAQQQAMAAQAADVASQVAVKRAGDSE